MQKDNCFLFQTILFVVFETPETMKMEDDISHSKKENSWIDKWFSRNKMDVFSMDTNCSYENKVSEEIDIEALWTVS